MPFSWTLTYPVYQNPTSWISEDDFYKPVTDESGSLMDQPTFGAALMNGSLSPSPEPEVPQAAPSVVHRRQMGEEGGGER